MTITRHILTLESVRKHQAGLQSFRSMRRIEASRRNASALRLRFSQSLASLRQRLSQAKVRSTTQRRGSTTNPFVRSVRLTISVSSCRQDLRQGLLKVRPLVAAIAIVDIGRMNDGVQQQTQRVYENMALRALDRFARVIAMRIDAAPPFSALFTLWLSTMAAVGLASRSPCSRHAT